MCLFHHVFVALSHVTLTGLTLFYPLSTVCPHTLSTQGKPNASAKGDHPRYWVTVGGTGDQKKKLRKSGPNCT